MRAGVVGRPMWHAASAAAMACMLVMLPIAMAAQHPLMHQQSTFAGGDNTLFEADNRLSDNRAGRFLHVTDMHPDQYYTPGAKINDACHDQSGSAQIEKKKKKKKKKAKRAGYWGAPVSVCDSPKHLIVATLDWLADNWLTSSEGESKGFDFIIWTGDTARHDIDFTHPRNAEEIFQYNRWVLSLFEERFPNTPIVPNVGNNDIIPHNIMFPGPNSMTRAFRDIWAAHIPADQHDAFLDGGYFVSEVIPDDLAVVSLNTLYWYDANAATRGCKKASEPGSLQLDWLEEQLFSLRNRSMQAHLIGHVPPTAGNLFAACYDRYSDIVLHFQDTIVGQHFGHMNVDAMFLQEDFSIAARDHTDAAHQDVHVQTLSSDLRKDYDLVPTHQKTNLDAYLPFFVGPSIVPTYLPTVRVWTYNNTRGSDDFKQALDGSAGRRQVEVTVDDDNDIDNDNNYDNEESELHRTVSTLGRSHRRPRHHKKHKKGHRSNLPRHTSSDSPSRKNGYLTMLGYSQWVLDLHKHNRRHEREGGDADGVAYQLEYTTYDEHTLWSDYLSLSDRADHVHRPVPKTLLDRELQRRKARAPSSVSIEKHRIDIPRKLRHLTDYRLPSMTVEHVLDWARELAANDKVWERFHARIYTESGVEE